jgi:large subunit ribosomal protein L18
MSTAKSHALHDRRARRVRYKMRTQRHPKVRLSVFRSQKHIYAQLIDDVKGETLASTSSLDKALKLETGTDIEAAQKVGAQIAKLAKSVKVSEVAFDRGGYLYHGRVKALADSAREAGLKF